MSETPVNPDIEAIIRESLAATKSWSWSDDDRKWSAAGTATKWLQANSPMSDDLANAMSLKIVEDIMKEEALAADLAAIEAEVGPLTINLSAQSVVTQEAPEMYKCQYCGRWHSYASKEWLCPLDPKYRDG